jgi:hypothetical protein
MSGTTHQSTRPVVFKRAAEDLDPSSSQGRGNGVTWIGLVGLAIKGKGKTSFTLDDLARLGQKPVIYLFRHFPFGFMVNWMYNSYNHL